MGTESIFKGRGLSKTYFRTDASTRETEKASKRGLHFWIKVSVRLGKKLQGKLTRTRSHGIPVSPVHGEDEGCSSLQGSLKLSTKKKGA